MVQLRDDQISRLDAEAARLGRSRSRVVRDVVDESLSPHFDESVAQRYSEAYPAPDGDERDGRRSDDTDEWGSLNAWHEAARLGRQGRRDPW